MEKVREGERGGREMDAHARRDRRGSSSSAIFCNLLSSLPHSLPWAQAFSRAWEPGVAGSHPQVLTRTLAAAAHAPNEEEE